jgi:Chalcone isomerase-like
MAWGDRRPELPMRSAILALCVAVAMPVAGPAHSRTVEGIDFPDYVEVADWQMPLRLSGVARVAHNYLPIYVVALYVGRARVDAGMLVKGLVPCRFVVHWQASATNDTEAYWLGQLQAQVESPADRERLGASIGKLAAALGGGTRGKELLVDYHPERGLRIGRSGQAPQTFAGLELARLVLGLWIGPAIRSDVRGPLLAGLDPKS